MSLSEGKKYFGNKAVLGGFDNREDGLLFSGTKEEIQSYTKELISKYGTTGILLGADCSFPAGIDKQRIQWVVDAVKNI